MFINPFFSNMYPLNGARSITLATNSVTLAGLDEWYAEKYEFKNDTTINGFAFHVTNAGRAGFPATFVCSVGISTAVGAYGIFPFTKSSSGLEGELLSANTGTAKTIAFIYELSAGTFTTATNSSTLSAGVFSTTITTVTGTAFTFLANTPYWVGMKVNSVTGSTSMRLTDLSTSTLNRFHMNAYANESFARTTANVGGTNRVEALAVIPLFSDSAAGTTEYYPKMPVLAYSDKTVSYASIGREFGIKFELNNFPIQDWQLSAVRFGFIGATNDAQYCMRIYDGANFDNVIATGSTVTGRDIIPNRASSNPYELEFHFDPPVQLRTNRTYFAGVAWTHPTSPALNANTSCQFNNNLGSITSDQSSLLAYRTTIGSGALSEYADFKPTLSFYIIRTKSGSRAIGN